MAIDAISFFTLSFFTHCYRYRFKKLMDVNVIGAVAVTKAFIPMIRNNNAGRIVFIGSISGLFALPGLSAYAASKHAIEAIADSLRIELYPFNIPVSIIEPGNVETPIWDKGIAFADEMLNKSDKEIINLYSPLLA